MTEMPAISTWQAWMLATRPKTLPAAVAPILVGTALAIHDGAFRPLPALAALAVSLLMQIAVNVANDYFDFVGGIDSDLRTGPMRVTQSGLIPPERVRLGMLTIFAAAGLIGLYLFAVAGWPVLVIGVITVLAALAYSTGPFPLASHGLGDIFVFIFFGLVAVGGTYFVQAQALPAIAILAAVAPGLLITAILVVNNLRDIATDLAAGKNTLAVRLGTTGARVEYIVLLGGAYIAVVWMAFTVHFSWWVVLPWLTLPLAVLVVREMYQESGSALNKTLSGTARLALIFSILLAAGMLV